MQLEKPEARADSWLWRQRQQQQRAGLERERAARSAALADWHFEQAALAPESMRKLHARLAALHRRMVERHLASAELHGLLAIRMDRRLGGPGGALRPVFMAAMLVVDELDDLIRDARAVAFGRAQDRSGLSAERLDELLG